MRLASSGSHRDCGDALAILLTPYCVAPPAERFREYFTKSMLPALRT
jgi:hypothetical protein